MGAFDGEVQDLLEELCDDGFVKPAGTNKHREDVYVPKASHVVSGAKPQEKTRKKRGRRATRSHEEDDKLLRLWDAPWTEGRKTFEEFGRLHGRSRAEVEKAINSARKRRKNSTD